jgi:hypothetical protein
MEHTVRVFELRLQVAGIRGLESYHKKLVAENENNKVTSS